MLRYVKIEDNQTLEIYEKVVLAYSDMQALQQVSEIIQQVSDYHDIEIRPYALKDFISPSNAFVDYWNTRMENTLMDVASIQLVHEDYDMSIDLFSKLCVALEDNWEKLSTENRVMRYANIQNLYEQLLRALINS